MLRRALTSVRVPVVGLGATTATTMSVVPAEQMRFKGQRAKKRPKPSDKFRADVKIYREEWMQDHRRTIADSLRGYMDYSTTRRTHPWDDRVAPFDRVETDGVNVLISSFMEDKLQLVNSHPRPTKRLFCNLGLIGPVVTNKARWKPTDAAARPVISKPGKRIFDTTQKNGGFND